MHKPAFIFNKIRNYSKSLLLALAVAWTTTDMVLKEDGSLGVHLLAVDYQQHWLETTQAPASF